MSRRIGHLALALSLSASVAGAGGGSLRMDEVWGRTPAAWAAELGGPVDRKTYPAHLSAIRALRAAGSAPQKQIPALIDELAVEPVDVDARLRELHRLGLRAEVAAALHELGPRTFTWLAPALTDDRPRIRAGVACALATFGKDAGRVTNDLRSALARETDPTARIWLRAALAGAVDRPGPFVDELLASLDVAIGRLNAREPGSTAPGDSDSVEIQEHLSALGCLGEVAAKARAKLDALGPLPEDFFGLQRWAAYLVQRPSDGQTALNELGRIENDLLEHWRSPATMRALHLHRGSIVWGIASMVEWGGAEEDDAIACAWLLNWMGQDAIGSLSAMAASESPVLAAAALKVLEEVAGPEHADALVPLLGRSLAIEQRRALASAFSRRGGAAALTALSGALDSREPLVQANSLRCLASLASTAPELLGWKRARRAVDVLCRSSDAEVRQEAVVTAKAIDLRVQDAPH